MVEVADLQLLIGDSETSVPTIPWTEIEGAIGFEFPADYKSWAEIYPSIEIHEYLWVRHPLEFYKVLGVNGIKDELRGMSGLPWGDNLLRRVFDSSGNEVQSTSVPRFYPQSGGLIPWGITDNGGCAMWDPIGPPSEWPVVIADESGIYWQEFDFGFLEFLLRIAQRKLHLNVWPETFPRSPAIKVHRGYEEGGGNSMPIFLPTSTWRDYFEGLD
jgi:hypothetical protein